MKSEDDNTSDATIIHASFNGEKNVETIQGMQPTLYHVNRETNEIGDIHLNSAFVCEETQPTPEDDVKTPPKSGTSAATSNDCASPQPRTYKARHAHKRLYTVLPKYSKIQVLPGITSCRLVKDNKQAIELNSLLINNMPEG